MNEIPQSEPAAPAEVEQPHRRRGWPRGKPRRQRRPKLVEVNEAKPQRQETSYLAGMTGGEGWNSHCPDVCNPKQGCVITRGEGSGFCAHPEKSGLQAADLLKPKVVERYNQARKYLAHQKADRR